MKVCKICNKEKEKSQFYKNKINKDGLHSYCKECTIKQSQNNRNENLEKRKEYDKEIYLKKKDYYIEKAVNWTKANIEQKQENYRVWQQNNKDKISEYRIARQENKHHDISDEEWLACKEYFNYSCAYCGLHEDEHFVTYAKKLKKTDLHKEHVDHQGENDLSNCVPSCKSCNGSKHIRRFDEWYINHPNYTKERHTKIINWLNGDFKNYIRKETLTEINTK